MAHPIRLALDSTVTRCIGQQTQNTATRNNQLYALTGDRAANRHNTGSKRLSLVLTPIILRGRSDRER
jgi:hypothetical protein